MPPEERRLPLATAALVVAMAPVVVLPELLGGVHPIVAAGAAVVELVALLLLVADRVRDKAPLALSFIGAPLALGLVVTLIERAPLPLVVRRVLSPLGTENAQWATALLPDDVRANVPHVLSLDPPATAFAAVRLAGAVALFVVVTQVAKRRRARALVYRMLLGAALLMFLVAVGHQLLHVQGAWGRFTMKTAFFYAPMVNTNQLARVFGALSLACGARALAVRSRIEMLWLAGGAVACGAGVFLTLSRGGMLAYLAAAAVLLVFLWRSRLDDAADDDAPRARTAVALGLAQLGVIAAVSLGLYLAREAIVHEAASLETDSLETSKLALYEPALSLLADYWRTGVGNNAFGVAFMGKAAPDLFGGSLFFTHPENIAIGTLVEHGVVAGGALIAVALAVGGVLFFSLRRREHLTPLPALFFLVFGDFFDFALESTIGIYLVAVLLGLSAGALVEEPRLRVTIWPRTAAALAAFLAIVVAALAPTAARHWRFHLDDVIRDDLRDARSAAHADEHTRLIEEALAANPLDAEYCYLLAFDARTVHRDPQRALAWANRAIYLWPTHRGAHIEAARALAATGHLDQAMLEYREAFVSGPPDDKIVREVMLRTTDLALRRKGLPDNVAAAGLLVEDLIREKRLDDAQIVVDDAVLKPDASSWLRRRAVQVALLRGDVAGAKARLAPLVAGTGLLNGDLVGLALSVAEAADGAAAAWDASAQWEKRTSNPKALYTWQLNTALRLNRLDDADIALGKLRKRAGDAATVDWLDRQEADLLGRHGETGKQLRLLERLAAHNPNDATLQLRVARMELDLGLYPQARATLARVPPGNADAIHLRAAVESKEKSLREERDRARLE